MSAYSYAKMANSYWHNPDTFPHPDYDTLKDIDFAGCCEMLMRNREKLHHESWHPQFAWLLAKQGEKEVLAVDRILRYETLGRDFMDLCEALNASVDSLPGINPSERSHYKEYYDEYTRSIIAQVYVRDIELFGYEFD